MDAAGQPVPRTFAGGEVKPPPKKIISLGSKRKVVQKKQKPTVQIKRFVKGGKIQKNFNVGKKTITLKGNDRGVGQDTQSVENADEEEEEDTAPRRKGRGMYSNVAAGSIYESDSGYTDAGYTRTGDSAGGGRRRRRYGGYGGGGGFGGGGFSDDFGGGGGFGGGGFGGGGGGGEFMDRVGRGGPVPNHHPRKLAGRLDQNVEPSEMIFPGQCKLFFGGLPDDMDEEKMRTLLEPYGEPVQTYIPGGKQFAIVHMDSREKAYKAMVCLNGITYEGKWLRVRPSPDAAVWVGDLPAVCSNELLYIAFSRWGHVLRAIVHCDTRGKSIGSGVVEFSRKGSAVECVEACAAQPFCLTATPHPVRVEPLDYCESDAGLPAKDMSTDRRYFDSMRVECSGQGPRLASKSEPIAMEWLKLYQTQHLAKQSLKERFVEERKQLLVDMRQSIVSAAQDRKRSAAEQRAKQMEIMQREQYLSQQRKSAMQEQRGFHSTLIEEEESLRKRQQNVLAQQKAIEAKLQRLKAKQSRGPRSISLSSIRGQRSGW